MVEGVGFVILTMALTKGTPSNTKALVALAGLGITVLVFVVIPLVVMVKYLGMLGTTGDEIRKRVLWGTRA